MVRWFSVTNASNILWPFPKSWGTAPDDDEDIAHLMSHSLAVGMVCLLQGLYWKTMTKRYQLGHFRRGHWKTIERGRFVFLYIRVVYYNQCSEGMKARFWGEVITIDTECGESFLVTHEFKISTGIYSGGLLNSFRLVFDAIMMAFSPVHQSHPNEQW